MDIDLSKLSKKEKIEFLKLQRILTIKKCRESFWEFCKAKDPDFYIEGRDYLKNICNTIQTIYENKLINEETNEPYRCMMLNVPPRHGKSRTLTNFTAWMLGKDVTNMVITVSYNDDSATEFSRFTRDIIDQDQNEETIAFKDVFPNAKLKQGNASVQKWALEGRFFNYLGAGFNGGITGKGCNVLIIDDPIKNAEEAMNEDLLDKLYKKYTDTLLSRVEGDGIQIIVMTRWAKKDLCGKILDSEDAKDWYVLNMPAYDEVKDEMLCDSVLDKKKYEKLKRNMSPLIFLSNYQQEPIDKQGLLYTSFKTYNPYMNMPNFEKVISYTDTADTGTDSLVTVVGGVYEGEIWLQDVYMSTEGMEKTEPELAAFMYEDLMKYNLRYAKVESNNGGRGFARNVERLLWENHKTRQITFDWFHQSQNKQARILANSNFVMQHVYFPENWKSLWPMYYIAMTTYQRMGKNKNDDAPDATTGLVEIIASARGATAESFERMF